jgi:hypothetical protein
MILGRYFVDSFTLFQGLQVVSMASGHHHKLLTLVLVEISELSCILQAHLDSNSKSFLSTNLLSQILDEII